MTLKCQDVNFLKTTLWPKRVHVYTASSWRAIRRPSGQVLITNVAFFPPKNQHLSLWVLMWCDVMWWGVLFCCIYTKQPAELFFFFLCSFPSVFIDRKQPVDIFLLWEKVGVMCITRNTLASIGIIDTDFSAKSAAFRHCHFTLAHITHLHFSLIVFSFSQFASARCLLSQGCTMCLKNIQQLKDVWPSCSSWMIASIPRRSAVRSSGGFKIPRLRCRQRNTT